MTTQERHDSTTPEFLIFVAKEVLSDKSEVFNVILGDHVFAATSRKDAEDLAEKIVAAINDHTSNTAVIMEW